MLKNLILTCGILVCTTFFVFGQATYRFNNYSIKDGLSQSSVTAIVQDDNNALWVGTQDGLNRFDGKTFEVFTSDDTDGLESEYIKCGLRSSDGKLWFGTTNGLTKYDLNTEKFTTYNLGQKVALQVEVICTDAHGNLWVGTAGQGVFIFDMVAEKFSRLGGNFPYKKITSIYCSAYNLYVNTEEKGCFKINLKSKEYTPISFPKPKSGLSLVLQIKQNDQGTILIGTTNGLYEYNEMSGKVRPKFTKLTKLYGSTGVSDMYKTKNGTWFLTTTNKGLFTILPNGKVYNATQDIFQKNALLINDINMLFCDKVGTFWLGTERGLSSFDPVNLGFLGFGPSGNLLRGIPNPNVWSFSEDPKGESIFIGTDISVSEFNRQEGTFKQYYRTTKRISDEAAETAVLSLFAISKNTILVGCVDGLFLLTIKSESDYQFKELPFFAKPENVKYSRIYCIRDFGKNRYLVGTKAGLLMVDLQKNEVTKYEHNSLNPKHSITSGVCRYIYKRKDGSYLIATSTGELNELTEKKGTIQIKPYPYNSELLKISKDYITSIHEVAKGVYWLGTFGSGLMYWNENTQKHLIYKRKDGLPNNVIYSVLSDKKGKLWLSTNKGICRFDPKMVKFNNFTEVNGLMSNEFNLGAYYKTKNGELFFGGISGFNYFHPASLKLASQNIAVKITKFKLDKFWMKVGEKDSPLQQPISKTAQLELSYRQRSFTLHFQPSDITNPQLVNYMYHLEGSDEGDIYLGSTNEIHFNSLSPGIYTLKIYAREGESNFGPPAELIIHIAPPFWSTWWFIALLIAFALLVIRFVWKFRIENERREQIRLEMKIAARTKEIRAQNIQIERQRKQLEEEKNKVVEQQRMLQIEKDKTEKLLKNVIPESTAEELKNKGSVGARAYKTVSVMFTDFVGFTKVAEHMDPTELVNRLDVYFRKFDEIIVKNNLEKIKTIGDAYMCAGGVPVRNNTNPIDACIAALQIQDYMRKRKNDAIITNSDYWELRLGINTGEVTAGVIGSERLAFDVWGATVNHAQRMEMLGEPGKVTVTGHTFLLVQPYFECVFRGKAQTKSSGLIDMYTVERIKPELSVNGEGIVPNERFHEIVNLHHYSSINYYNAERHIIQVLQQGLSDKLYYHSIEHTQDVVKAVERIALMEGVTDEGLFLLKTAATYHDAGFVEKYEKNEEIGARMAEEILPKYGYTEEHIQQIKELIFVTQIPHKPSNKLEEIICDADLDYLGREDFHEIADRLRQELREHGKINSDRAWDEIQVQFISNHKYFTNTSVSTRRATKLKNLEEIKERLDRNEYND